MTEENQVDPALRKPRVIEADIAGVADSATAHIGPGKKPEAEDPVSAILNMTIEAVRAAVPALAAVGRASQHTAIVLWDDPLPNAPNEFRISFGGQPGFEAVLPKIVDSFRKPEQSYLVMERHSDGPNSMRVVKSREPFPPTSNTMVFELGDRPIRIPTDGTWGQFYAWQDHGGEWVPKS